MDLRERLHKIRLAIQGEEEETVEAPVEWVVDEKLNEEKVKKVTIRKKKKRKFRLPGLRFFNRLLSGSILIVNLLFAIISVSTEFNSITILFLGNVYISFRYLWSSRKKTVVDWVDDNR